MTEDNKNKGLTNQMYRDMVQVVDDRRQQGQKIDKPDLQRYGAGR